MREEIRIIRKSIEKKEYLYYKARRSYKKSGDLFFIDLAARLEKQIVKLETELNELLEGVQV